MVKKPTKNNFYRTSEIKLAALLLCEIPNSDFEVEESSALSPKKTVIVDYFPKYEKDVHKLVADFINKKASCNIYTYNRALFLIRNAVRGRL